MATKYAPQDIRNVALIGNSGSGKTSLAEALLFLSGATETLGCVRSRTSVLDSTPEAQRRQHSVTTGLTWLAHDGCKLNILDVPGHRDLSHELEHALHAVDAAVLVVNAAEGVRDQDASAYRAARRLGLPVAIFVNHLDHEGADADACVKELEEVLEVSPVPLQLPLGQGSALRGVLSLFQRCAYVYQPDGSYTREPLSDEMDDDVEGAWLQLTENVAETDEDLLMIYLETFSLSRDQVRSAFQGAFRDGTITPVLFGAATRCIGGAALLELVSWAFPSPLQRPPLPAADSSGPCTVEPSADGPFLARVIHSRIDDYGAMRSLVRIVRGKPPVNGHLINTTRHGTEQLRNPSWLRGRERSRATSLVCGDIFAVKKLKSARTGDTLSVNGQSIVLHRPEAPERTASLIVRSETLAGEAALQAALERACAEDEALTLEEDPISHRLLLRGVGPAHLRIALDRLRRREELVIVSERPPIAYRETIRAPALGVQGEHRRRPNGVGVYGACTLDVAPITAAEGLRFQSTVDEDALPANFIAAIKKGIHDRMSSGFLAGYPITGLAVTLIDSGHHPLDSKEAAYQVAAARALQAAFEQQGTALLEPVCVVEISLPAGAVQAVMSDLMARRGRVLEMEVRTQSASISALAPQAELDGYRTALRELTEGRGDAVLRPAGYEPVPARLAEAIIASSPFRHSVAG